MNLKIKDKIIKLGNKYGLSSSAILLMDCLMMISENGKINNFSSYKNKFVSAFPGGLNDYYKAFQELVNSRFVEYDEEENFAFIRPFISTYYYSILGIIEGRKRRILKTKDTKVKAYNAYQKKFGHLFDLYNTEDEPIRYRTKSNGVKIPDSLRPYFTSEPLLDDKTKFDISYIELESKRRNLTKEEKRVYYSCIKFADSNGVIEDYDTRSLISSIIFEFGYDSVCQSTVYLAIKKLLKLRLVYVEFYYDYSLGKSVLRKRLIVAGYKEAFIRKERYVIIPDVVLEQAFKKCTNATIKAFFWIVFRLNNGDGGDKINTGINKAVPVSFEKFIVSKNKRSLEHLAWFKKRYPGEFCTMIWGDINREDINSLAYFFRITPLGNNGELTYLFRIRKEFYISKSAELFKKSLELTGKDKRRLGVIEEACRKHNVNCNNDDLIDLVKVFRGAGKIKIDKTISVLADRINLGKDRGWPDIKNIPAYVRTLFINLRDDLPADSSGFDIA